jgi:hypothetical protein
MGMTSGWVFQPLLLFQMVGYSPLKLFISNGMMP